jgi:glycosyltransferase involved in cell wall biosynthesis
MPAYNQAKYLPEAIESVLRQTYADFEFLIIDDRSTDNSADIIGSYARKDRRIRFLVNDRNIGMVNNWNRCIEEASGVYIKFLFGDDVLASPAALEKMASALDLHAEVALVASARNVINEDSDVIQVLSEFDAPMPLRGTDVIKQCFADQINRIGEPSAVMFRKNLAGRGFDTRYVQIVDVEMWYRVLEQGDFLYLNEPLCSFRMHREQQTRANVTGLRHLNDAYLAFHDYLNKPYMDLPRLTKEIMVYAQTYAIWKLYSKHGKIPLKTAVEWIRKYYGLARFFGWYPLYKLYKLASGMVKPKKRPEEI